MSLGRVLSVEAVAEALGLAPATVRRMLRRGELPGVRLAGQWRVRERTLEAWLASREGERGRLQEAAVRALRGFKTPRRLAVPPTPDAAVPDVG